LTRESGISREPIGRINGGFIYPTMVESTGLKNILAYFAELGAALWECLKKSSVTLSRELCRDMRCGE
jgi:hypothetical protein